MHDDATTQQNARSFMESVRQRYSESGASLHKSGVQDGHKFVLRATAQSCEIPPSPGITLEVKIKLLETFEGICLKQGMEIPEGLRPAIMNILVEELRENQSALRTKPEKVKELAFITAKRGAVGPELVRDFPEFATTPNFYHVIATKHSDPVDYANRTRETLNRLAADPEFERLRNRRATLLEAVWKHPSHPEEFLRDYLSGGHRKRAGAWRNRGESHEKGL